MNNRPPQRFTPAWSIEGSGNPVGRSSTVMFSTSMATSILGNRSSNEQRRTVGDGPWPVFLYPERRLLPWLTVSILTVRHW